MGSKKNLLYAGNAQIEGLRVFLISMILSLYSLSGLFKRVNNLTNIAELLFKSSLLNIAAAYATKLGRGY